MMSRKASGTWRVRYANGADVHQYDVDNVGLSDEIRQLAKVSGEVPFRAIVWDQVETLTLASQWVECSYRVLQPPPGFALSLRSRHFMTLGGDLVWCYLLVVALAGEPVSDASTVAVFYWFPDGSTHECSLFNCGDVARYGAAQVHEHSATLAPLHETKLVDIDAALV